MKTKHVKEAIFFSDMNSKLWKSRFEMEAKELSDKKAFVQLRPEADEICSSNLKWEYEFLKGLRGGYIQQIRLPTAKSSGLVSKL
mmetsp:Transcript_24132/g.45125  ORF Transcript_24132/g.45125 Transcript_24132/m.45125 type:complete len:85 (-) Transcript_24132:250-504(-)